MISKENRIQRQSRRMKDIYKYADVCSHLVLTQNEQGEWIFKLNELTQEQIDFVNRMWCNGGR